MVQRSLAVLSLSTVLSQAALTASLLAHAKQSAICSITVANRLTERSCLPDCLSVCSQKQGTGAAHQLQQAAQHRCLGCLHTAVLAAGTLLEQQAGLGMMALALFVDHHPL